MSKRKFTDDQEQVICARYLAGESTVKLGFAYGVSDVCIGGVLKRNGVKARNRIQAAGGVDPKVETQICDRYKTGESSNKLSADFDVSPTAIKSILKRNNVQPRSRAQAKGGLAPAAEQELCTYYKAGASSIELAASFGVDKSTVCAILKRSSIKIRSRKSLSLEAEAEICQRYEQGENTTQLSAAYGVAFSTIPTILKRYGVSTRDNSQSKGGLGPAAKTEVCDRYKAGENTKQLAVSYGVTDVTIANVLKRNGIDRRDSGSFKDSVQHALGGTGCYSAQRQCEFYICELAGYASTHCKPGISFDLDQRADAKYGIPVLRLVFATRQEAYFLERAVLGDTRELAHCPNNLKEWQGSSEVRSMPANDLEPIALRLADELDELGLWAFAATYVPMTAAQRAICQQRASVNAPLSSFS